MLCISIASIRHEQHYEKYLFFSIEYSFLTHCFNLFPLYFLHNILWQSLIALLTRIKLFHLLSKVSR